MSLVSEAVARYHKLIESAPYIDLNWARPLQERIQAERLQGRLIAPVLRPHFLTNREYAALVKSAETLLSAIARLEKLVLETPALLARVHLLPAERMLASVGLQYSELGVTALLDTSLAERSLHFAGHGTGIPPGVLYGEALTDLYYDAGPMKEFRKKHKLKKLGGSKQFLQAVLKSYKSFGGKNKKPNIAIVELKQPFQTATSDHAPLAAMFTREGYQTEIIAPEHLDYRNGRLRAGDFEIDIVYRRVKLQDFLIRYDLNHALVRAYKEGAICMVNNFRSEIGAKRAIFDLLTDSKVTAKFPAAERRVIEESVPWTRLVEAAKATYKDQTVDLPEFVLKHQDKLVLRPNDAAGETHPVYGASVDEAQWEKSLKQAMRSPWVVQEVAEASHAVFPLLQYGSLVMKDMQTHLHPHAFLGQVAGASTWMEVAGGANFSTLNGLAPTFLLEGK